MRRRVLELTLRAYPRQVRRRDGELSSASLSSGGQPRGVREVLGLLRGGLAERRRNSRTRRAVVVGVAAATALVLAALTWTATAQGARVEEDELSCAAQCSDTLAEVEARVSEGWTCTEHRGSAEVTWRCTRD